MPNDMGRELVDVGGGGGLSPFRGISRLRFDDGLFYSLGGFNVGTITGVQHGTG